MITITFDIEHDHTDEFLGTHTKRFVSLDCAVRYMYDSYIPSKSASYAHLPENSGLYSELLDNYLAEIQPIKRKYLDLAATDIEVADDVVIDSVHLV